MQVDGYKKTGCFNSMCPGFVQVNPGSGLGVAIQNSSIIGSEEKSAYPIEVKQVTYFKNIRPMSSCLYFHLHES